MTTIRIRPTIRDAYRLKDVLQTEALVTLFQPVVTLAEGTIIGREALTRGPEGPLQTPGQLFSVAREYGLTVELDQTCARLAVSRFARAQRDGLLFINAMPTSIEQGGFRELGRWIEEGSVDPGQVVVEITEEALSEDTQAFFHEVAYLRGMGIRIALDDLGTGYANWGLLADLAPDFMKLDLGFVRGLGQSATRQTVVEMLVTLAERIDSTIVAEGIEHAEDANILADLGVRLGQGFFYARPE